MKVYSDKLVSADLWPLPAGVHFEVLQEIARPKVRTRGWTIRLGRYTPSAEGAYRLNPGTGGRGIDHSVYAAGYRAHGEWMARLFEIDPDARIAGYEGVADFHAQTRGEFAGVAA